MYFDSNRQAMVCEACEEVKYVAMPMPLTRFIGLLGLFEVAHEGCNARL